MNAAELFTNPDDYLSRGHHKRSRSSVYSIQQGLVEPFASLRQHAIHTSGREDPHDATGDLRRIPSSASFSQPPQPPECRNVVLFGGTGCGKSSIVNMLDTPSNHAGKTHEALVKSAGTTVTTIPRRYKKVIQDEPFAILDTAGLSGGGEKASISLDKAISDFHELVIRQTQFGGIHLALLVMKGGRILKAEESYFKLLRYICGPNIPLAVVFTHLENEDDLDQWWENEKEELDFLSDIQGAACITAIKGKDGVYLSEYEESKGTLERLIVDKALAVGCGVPVVDFHRSVHYIDDLRLKLFGPRPQDFHDEVAAFLQDAFGLGVDTAARIAYRIAPHR